MFIVSVFNSLSINANVEAVSWPFIIFVLYFIINMVERIAKMTR